jgi:DNA-directed RNA polymerase specialized sigma24 family protein
MARPPKPSGGSVAGNTERGDRRDILLDDLRNGEREAFVRFYDQYRLPVYTFVARQTHGSPDAAAITREVFIQAFRRVVLTGAAFDVRPWVFGIAVETCAEHASHGEAGRPVADPDAREAEASAQHELGRRFELALLDLSERHRAALLLTDVHGLTIDEAAVAIGAASATMPALLFRAGEAFRLAFEEVSRGASGSVCRLAEQAAAGSVGRGAPVDDMRRLHVHASYCAACAAGMAAWRAGAAGLALVLEDIQLPKALESPPVFTTDEVAAVAVATGTVASGAASGRRSGVAGALAVIGRALTSKAAAYALALVCLAAVAGMALYVTNHDWRQIVVRTIHSSSTAVVPPVANAPKPAAPRSSAPRATTAPKSAAVVKVKSSAAAPVRTSFAASRVATASGRSHESAATPGTSRSGSGESTTGSGESTTGSHTGGAVGTSGGGTTSPPATGIGSGASSPGDHHAGFPDKKPPLTGKHGGRPAGKHADHAQRGTKLHNAAKKEKHSGAARTHNGKRSGDAHRSHARHGKKQDSGAKHGGKSSQHKSGGGKNGKTRH